MIQELHITEYEIYKKIINNTKNGTHKKFVMATLEKNSKHAHNN